MRLAETGQVIEAAFSTLVRDRVRIRQRQLVAIDTAAAPPEISWRWFIGQVEAVTHDGVSVRRLDQPPGSSRLVSNPLPVSPISAGSEVYYGRLQDWEVVDTVSGDAPANARRVAERHFGNIEAKLSE